jgi:hypothetical protein
MSASSASRFQKGLATICLVLLDQRWTPPGANLPQHPLDPETIAAIIRIHGWQLPVLDRLLTQIERILEVNALEEVTKAVVDAARGPFVIGQS